MRYIDPPPIRTQFLIFSIFGDHVYPRDLAVSTGGLLQLLKLLGVNEQTARSTLSRMKLRGWLQTQRVGRLSAYQLTPKGVALMNEGSQRLFGTPPDTWDGCWQLIVYSLPQELRSLRHQLRTRLSWLGFGMLQPGMMVAATAQQLLVQQLFEELDVGSFVHYFSHANLVGTEDIDIVSRCWDLATLNRRYTEYIERHTPFYEKFASFSEDGPGVPAAAAFMHRFWATYEYSSFPRQDPNLPLELLPPEWRGREATDLLARYRSLLKEPSQDYIRDTLGIEPVPDLSLEEVTVVPMQEYSKVNSNRPG